MEIITRDLMKRRRHNRRVLEVINEGQNGRLLWVRRE